MSVTNAENSSLTLSTSPELSLTGKSSTVSSGRGAFGSWAQSHSQAASSQPKGDDSTSNSSSMRRSAPRPWNRQGRKLPKADVGNAFVELPINQASPSAGKAVFIGDPDDNGESQEEYDQDAFWGKPETSPNPMEPTPEVEPAEDVDSDGTIGVPDQFQT